jgi:manganese/iron transport system permease protein
VSIVSFLTDPWALSFMQRGLAAALMVGIVCAIMGTFVVLKGMAFIGDAVSHAAFPGLVIAYLLGIPLYLGGAVAAVSTALAIGWVSRRGGLRFDTAVGVLFAGMFALGIVLFSAIDNYVADLFSFLVGNVLGITVGDLAQIALLGTLVLAIVFVLRKELLYATFDPAGAGASGLPVSMLEYLLLRAAPGSRSWSASGGRDHHGRRDARDAGGDRPAPGGPLRASWWRCRSPSPRRPRSSVST